MSNRGSVTNSISTKDKGEGKVNRNVGQTMGKLFSLQTLATGMGNNSVTGQPNQHIKKLLTFDLNGVTSTNI